MSDASLVEVIDLLNSGKLTSEQLVQQSYDRIEQLESSIKACNSIKKKAQALKEAKAADKKRSTNSTKKLLGIPFMVKDAYVESDLPTTAGSVVLENFQSPFVATVCQKLLDEGAILLGKNAQDAWGHGGSTENTDFNTTKNPWDADRIVGGSSGGSAAAVSAGYVPFAIGEDTGGSIRNPSSMCSISGLKVTYGRVSRYGAIAYASSLDTVGPMARTTEDIAYLLEIMSGEDSKDSSSSQTQPDNYTDSLSEKPENCVIGLPTEYFTDDLDPEIKKVLESAKATFEKLGYSFKEVSIPFLEYGVAIYYLIALSETSSNLARYDGVRFGNRRSGFTPETKRRIMLGTYALSAGYADKLYKNAQKARAILMGQFSEAFKTCDVLLAPITPSLPNKLGSLISDPVKNMLEDLYTGTINVAGLPSVAIPAGFSKEKLPVGMQIIGDSFQESKILQIGHHFQQHTDWHKQQPPIIKRSKQS